VLRIFRMQEHRERASAIKPGLRGIRRRCATGPFQYQRGRHVRDGSFCGKIRKSVQGCLLRGKLHSEGAVETDEAVDMVMHHDAHPGHG